MTTLSACVCVGMIHDSPNPGQETLVCVRVFLSVFTSQRNLSIRWAVPSSGGENFHMHHEGVHVKVFVAIVELNRKQALLERRINSGYIGLGSFVSH